MYDEILLTLDGSPFAEAAIPHALALGAVFSARVTLLNVVEPIGIYSQPGVVGPVVSATVNIDEEMDRMREYLENVAARFREQGIAVRKIVRNGDAAGQVCDYARENEIDLIVMSTHGRSGLQRLVYGSVADRVLRGADAPVLLIRAHPETKAETP